MTAQVIRFSDYKTRPPTWSREPGQVDSVIILPVIRIERVKMKPKRKSR